MYHNIYKIVLAVPYFSLARIITSPGHWFTDKRGTAHFLGPHVKFI